MVSFPFRPPTYNLFGSGICFWFSGDDVCEFELVIFMSSFGVDTVFIPTVCWKMVFGVVEDTIEEFCFLTVVFWGGESEGFGWVVVFCVGESEGVGLDVVFWGRVGDFEDIGLDVVFCGDGKSEGIGLDVDIWDVFCDLVCSIVGRVIGNTLVDVLTVPVDQSGTFEVTILEVAGDFVVTEI